MEYYLAIKKNDVVPFATRWLDLEGIQQYVNRELPDVQSGFRKGRGTRDQIAKSAGSSKKQENSRKTSISALLTIPQPLTEWVTINCGKF